MSATLTKQPKATRSTVGLKILMASTGALLVFFLIAHMYGNLKMFPGATQFNEYAHHLRTMFEPILPYEGFLWIMRVVLLAALIGHVYSAAQLWGRANRARGSRYVAHKTFQQTVASKTMRWGGLLLLAFIIFHLLQFTTKTIVIGGATHTPYDMVVAAFHNWFVVLFYTAAVIAAGFHLRHGIWSATQTLGLTTAANQRVVNLTATVIAAVVTLGFLAVPFSVLFGWI